MIKGRTLISECTPFLEGAGFYMQCYKIAGMWEMGAGPRNVGSSVGYMFNSKHNTKS